MKKLILYIVALFTIQLSFAQNISFNPKLAKNQGPNSNFQIDAKSVFTNNSSDTVFEWAIIDLTAPSGWENSAIGKVSPMVMARPRPAIWRPRRPRSRAAKRARPPLI